MSEAVASAEFVVLESYNAYIHNSSVVRSTTYGPGSNIVVGYNGADVVVSIGQQALYTPTTGPIKLTELKIELVFAVSSLPILYSPFLNSFNQLFLIQVRMNNPLTLR